MGSICGTMMNRVSSLFTAHVCILTILAPTVQDEVPQIEQPTAVEEPAKEQEHFLDDEEDGWYLGKARDEFRRRRGMQAPDREEDPVQVRHV